MSIEKPFMRLSEKNAASRTFVIMLVISVGVFVIYVLSRPARRDSYQEMLERNAKSQLHAIIMAAQSNVSGSIYDKLRYFNNIDSSMLKMPNITNAVYVVISERIFEDSTNSVVAYWPIIFHHPSRGDKYLGITGSYRYVWMDNMPEWPSVNIKQIVISNINKGVKL